MSSSAHPLIRMVRFDVISIQEGIGNGYVTELTDGMEHFVHPFGQGGADGGEGPAIRWPAATDAGHQLRTPWIRDVVPPPHATRSA